MNTLALLFCLSLSANAITLQSGVFANVTVFNETTTHFEYDTLAFQRVYFELYAPGGSPSVTLKSADSFNVILQAGLTSTDSSSKQYECPSMTITGNNSLVLLTSAVPRPIVYAIKMVLQDVEVKENVILSDTFRADFLTASSVVLRPPENATVVRIFYKPVGVLTNYMKGIIISKDKCFGYGSKYDYYVPLNESQLVTVAELPRDGFNGTYYITLNATFISFAYKISVCYQPGCLVNLGPYYNETVYTYETLNPPVPITNATSRLWDLSFTKAYALVPLIPLLLIRTVVCCIKI